MDIVGGVLGVMAADEVVGEEVAEEADIRATGPLEEKAQGTGDLGKLYLTWENTWIKLLW